MKLTYFDDSLKKCKYRIELTDGRKVYSNNKRELLRRWGRKAWYKLFNNKTGELIKEHRTF